MASLMVFSILPSFLTEKLGLSLALLGTMEGICIATSFISKVGCGFACDFRLGRKPFILVGSLLSTVSKFFFISAVSGTGIFVARFFDRLSKGVRSAPTDAFIADMSEKKVYGRAYGFRQSLYTFGAVVGAVLAMTLMWLSDNSYRLVFCFSILPNIVAIVIYYCYVKKNKSAHQRQFVKIKDDMCLSFKQLSKLPGSYWYTIALASILMLARFSEAFLILRVKEFGCPVFCLPLTIVVMDVVHAIVASPFGRLADRSSNKVILFVGTVCLALTHFLLVYANSLFHVFVCVAIAGLSMGMSQGLLKSMTAESIPPFLRGSGFALFYLVSGIFILVSNMIAGYLSQHFGLDMAFFAGGCFALLGSVCLLLRMYYLSCRRYFSKKLSF